MLKSINYKKELFEDIVKDTLNSEGGYSKCESDPGGETKYGISKRSYPDLDIENLSLDEAKKIYYLDFWIKFKCYKLKDKKMAAKFFDLCVNMGGYRATKLLQRSLCSFGKNVISDGVIGEETINAVNSVNNLGLVESLVREAKNFYVDIVEQNPKLKIFLSGWLKRADSYFT